MRFKHVYAVYFSATGNTRMLCGKLADQLAEGLGISIPAEVIDFTLPAGRLPLAQNMQTPRSDAESESASRYSFSQDDLVVFGMPTYAGKLPNKLLPFVKYGFWGNGAAAAALVTYGNRSFDNAPAELCACLAQAGFIVIGAGAFAAQHAFLWDEKSPAFRRIFDGFSDTRCDSEEKQNRFADAGACDSGRVQNRFSDARCDSEKTLGRGRPDAQDMHALSRFGEALIRKLADGGPKGTEQNGIEQKGSEQKGRCASGSEAIDICVHGTERKGSCELETVPGDPDAPYYTPFGIDGKPKVFLKAKPKREAALCYACGTCASVCPMGSIAPEEGFSVNGICIKCHACVRACPQGARYFDDEAYLSHREMLVHTYTKRREPVWWT